jgi:REP element-mobilizing transposase RayT
MLQPHVAIGRFEYHPFYRRCLPHIQPPDATLFITFRLAGSLSRAVLERLAEERLGQAGAFWLHESYDHYVRDEKELSRIITYVLNNPVKAGLIKRWQEWQWSYCKDT